MLRVVAREAAKRSRALQLQQQRFLNVHEYQASPAGVTNPRKPVTCESLALNPGRAGLLTSPGRRRHLPLLQTGRQAARGAWPAHRRLPSRQRQSRRRLTCACAALPLAPQGAQIMSEYGVNVPPGIPVFKADQVAGAAKKMADEAGEVRRWRPSGGLRRRQPCLHICARQLCMPG